jgi:hypothetical protein
MIPPHQNGEPLRFDPSPSALSSELDSGMEASQTARLLRSFAASPVPAASAALRSRVLRVCADAMLRGELRGKTSRERGFSLASLVDAITSWPRLVLAGTAAAVAAVVLVIGGVAPHASRTAPSADDGRWVSLHDAREPVHNVRLRNDPGLDGLAIASLDSIDPLERP